MFVFSKMALPGNLADSPCGNIPPGLFDQISSTPPEHTTEGQVWCCHRIVFPAGSTPPPQNLTGGFPVLAILSWARPRTDGNDGVSRTVYRRHKDQPLASSPAPALGCLSSRRCHGRRAEQTTSSYPSWGVLSHPASPPMMAWWLGAGQENTRVSNHWIFPAGRMLHTAPSNEGELPLEGWASHSAHHHITARLPTPPIDGGGKP